MSATTLPAKIQIRNLDMTRRKNLCLESDANISRAPIHFKLVFLVSLKNGTHTLDFYVSSSLYKFTTGSHFGLRGGPWLLSGSNNDLTIVSLSAESSLNETSSHFEKVDCSRHLAVVSKNR